jgi:hypothetical protein
VKFWLDNDYGMVLKMESGENGWEVTEFKSGGVKAADWINLADFTIK